MVLEDCTPGISSRARSMSTAHEGQLRPINLRVIVCIFLINNIKTAGVHTHGTGEGERAEIMRDELDDGLTCFG